MDARGDLYLWTIYHGPTDYPGQYVLRRFRVSPNGSHPAPDVVVSDTLEPLQNLMMDKGLVRIGRAEYDEAQIVESWI